MRRAAAAMLLLLAACDPCHAPEGWTVTGEAIPDGVEVAIEAARAASPCELLAWGGSIEYQLLPFIWGPERVLADGCVDDAACNPHIKVASFDQPVEATALAHELGHVIWVRCGLSSYDAARGCHPRAFLEWVWTVDARVAERLGRLAPATFEVPACACPD